MYVHVGVCFVCQYGFENTLQLLSFIDSVTFTHSKVCHSILGLRVAELGTLRRLIGQGVIALEGRIRLDKRKKFFTVRVMRHCNKLPREVVVAPSLTVFKARLDWALSNLAWWKMSLPMAGWLEVDNI